MKKEGSAISAVWALSRAAARRRRLQTIVIGVVTFISAATLVVALGLLSASTAPFEHAFAQQRGAQLVTAFDKAKVTDGQLAATRTRPGVTASAGPFPQASVDVAQPGGTGASLLPAVPPGPLTVVGRPSSDGAVDRLDLWLGHWPTGPGEVVVNRAPTGKRGLVGSMIELQGGRSLKVVGAAYSVSQSAGAWVTPAEAITLGARQSQMLYRFASAATPAQVRADLASVTHGLPPGALAGSRSYLSLEQQYSTSVAQAYVPFLMAFGILALIVAVVMVVNVVSGAVVAGLRNIGVMKAVGYTPNQVAAVYLVMILIPTAAGTIFGTVAGALVSKPVLSSALQGLGLPAPSVSPWPDLAVLAGLPALVVLAALASARRAKRLPAAQAITAGAVPSGGHALRAQRALAGTRLSRAVSLGLGLPFARPARTALTVATVVLGVTAVTLAAGLTSTVITYSHLASRASSVQVTAAVRGNGHRLVTVPAASDRHTAGLLRAVPGTRTLTAELHAVAEIVGSGQRVDVDFLRGDTASLGYPIVKGHWIDGPAQAVVGPGFLEDHDLAVGDRLTLTMGGAAAAVTIVGETWSYDSHGLMADWHTATVLAPGRGATGYEIGLRAGTSVGSYISAASRADPSLAVQANGAVNGSEQLIGDFSTVFTVLLAVVAALGVLNTILLTVTERRRDIGLLKSIGMTPRQVTAMMITFAAALGVVGSLIGVPAGIIVHRVVVPLMVHAIGAVLPGSLLDVWGAGLIAVLAVSGIVIAAGGAFVPARNAGRLTVATVLHNE
jgi:putative ABC transport system permease protein